MVVIIVVTQELVSTNQIWYTSLEVCLVLPLFVLVQREWRLEWRIWMPAIGHSLFLSDGCSELYMAVRETLPKLV